MAYNRKNLLLFIIDVQEAYQAAKQPGVSHIYVYKAVIFPRFRISKKTLENYLATPAKKELKEMDAQRQQQLKIFPDETKANE